MIDCFTRKYNFDLRTTSVFNAENSTYIIGEALQ